MSAHVVKDSATNQNQLLEALTEETMTNFKISHTTFQIEEEGYKEDIVHS
jgi:cobalt-zinc-cadmium efflux system protein